MPYGALFFLIAMRNNDSHTVMYLAPLTNDIRPKQLARDLVRPPKKEGVNPYTLAFLKLVLADKSKSVLFATFPSSGWNWCKDIMNFSIVEHHIGHYEISYKKGGTLKRSEQISFDITCPADSRASNKELLRNELPGLDLDYCFHTHGKWKESSLWGLDNTKTIMVARDIRTALYSYAAKRRKSYKDFEECLEKTQVLDRAVCFYNSWAQYRKRYPDHFFVFHYEDFKKEPTEQFQMLINTAFNINIPQTLVAKAVDYFDFNKQKQREKTINPDDMEHFHYKGQIDYQNEMGESCYRRLGTALNDRLINNFGYDY